MLCLPFIFVRRGTTAFIRAAVGLAALWVQLLGKNAGRGWKLDGPNQHRQKNDN
jgi:hypothetical protein